MEFNTLCDFYSKIKYDRYFNNFYNDVTTNCYVHSPIKDIFDEKTQIYDYLLCITELFFELKLNLLYANASKMCEEVSNKNLRAKYIMSSVLCEAIIKNHNYDSVELNLAIKKASMQIHNTTIKDADLSKQLKIFNIFEQTLNKISPCVENICKCKRPLDNFEIYDYDRSIHRIDGIEQIIWGSKINSFNYFEEIVSNFKTLSQNELKILSPFGKRRNPEIITSMKKSDEKLICEILDYFQLVKPKNNRVYIYNNQLISEHKLECVFEWEQLKITHVKMPDYCFICEKYDTYVDYEIANDKYIRMDIKDPVRDFSCILCRKKVIDYLKLERIGTLPGIITKTLDENKIRHKILKNYFIKRRLKHIMIIMANLFDADSTFATVPVDIIYHIIRSIYWSPLNSISDEQFYTNYSGQILYSKFRSIFGVKSI